MFLTEDLTENKKKKETKQNVLTSIINLIRKRLFFKLNLPKEENRTTSLLTIKKNNHTFPSYFSNK